MKLYCQACMGLFKCCKSVKATCLLLIKEVDFAFSEDVLISCNSEYKLEIILHCLL